MVDQTAFDIKNDKKVFHLFFFRSTAAFNVFFYKWQTAYKLKVSYQRQYFEDRIENRRFPSREHSNPLQNQVALLAQSVMRPAERKDTAGTNFRDCSNVGLRYSPDKSLSCGYKYKGNQLCHLLDSTIHQFKQLGPDLGRFPLLRNFSVRTHVKFTRVNKIEAMYERPSSLTPRLSVSAFYAG